MTLRKSMLTSVDSYKTSHFKQYPPGTTRVSSYIEARAGGKYDKTLFFGLQAFIKEYILPGFTLDQIRDADWLLKQHGVPFNKEGWVRMYNRYDGKFPLEITAVDEGTILPVGNVLVQVHNTDPEFPWLTSWIETALMRAVWYPTSVATISLGVKEIIWESLQKTCDNPENEINFKLHDFGARGATSFEAAALGGMAHLVNFMGTDTVEALEAVKEYYPFENFPAFSIPASEHSTITSWGRAGERKAYENMLDQFKDNPIIACVSDSYDLWAAVSGIWGEDLREKVLARNGTLVVRPDSGNPVSTPNEVVMLLATKFGYTVNSKGFKVLNPHVRVIQGDGCTPDIIKQIIERLNSNGFSTENMAFGMGGGLLQKVDRDTIRFAMKASSITINGEEHDVYKDPITDHKKVSKRGRLALIHDGESFITVKEDEAKGKENLLKPVYKDFKLVREQSFDDIRKIASNWMES